jgi:hypothetical protein
VPGLRLSLLIAVAVRAGAAWSRAMAAMIVAKQVRGDID